ncbi:[FeFe] hydrogenase H-cluster radical SAM maturase HydE [Acetobacterium fimetarium]|uniref:[FeFe] hydrogenase H-cluster radical SAM maturase HydE n=1 Tax=Acetobacterium fimetarium TaxID=52691 RepID=A0ABR6WT44_9FIRM|nr:[FeFe] hydrogenase H-cluster radical SAM maturase HydE [Acetobacterium fimetarium]MBC3803782.1 [FeFe] hydrogenase H-cluster radical SAM maturase HydE [Acetobacterium fimetarium]
MNELIKKLEEQQNLKSDEMKWLLENNTPELRQEISLRARAVAEQTYGKDVYTRGLIEFTNYCKNDCYYCGIRKSNAQAHRYRLSQTEIMACCKTGHELGFRTFVLQGGEDPAFKDDQMVEIVRGIRKEYPDCAITLSIGEKSRESYQAFFEAGANRYLLRHETATEEHYRKLHPRALSLRNRKRCLKDLKEIGYQVGTGFMVGSPHQTVENIIADLCFIKELNPEMIGIGPFIPHQQTPYQDARPGTLEETLLIISILRLMLPKALIPATTALGTIDPEGRELGILAGANVVMPNLSPVEVRKDYALYDNKICTGDEAAECRVCLSRRMESIGYEIVNNRGDHPNKKS